jgi:hypothetical protein
MSTFPLGNNVAVWPPLATVMVPVGTKLLVAPLPPLLHPAVVTVMTKVDTTVRGTSRNRFMPNTSYHHSPTRFVNSL